MKTKKVFTIEEQIKASQYFDMIDDSTKAFILEIFMQNHLTEFYDYLLSKNTNLGVQL